LREREERARRKFLSSEEVKESSENTFQQIWTTTLIVTHPKEKPYSRRKAQKSRKRNSSNGMNFEANLSTNFEAFGLLKSVRFVQQVRGMFFEVGCTTFTIVLLLEKIVFWLLADWHDFQGRIQARKSR